MAQYKIFTEPIPYGWIDRKLSKAYNVIHHPTNRLVGRTYNLSEAIQAKQRQMKQDEEMKR